MDTRRSHWGVVPHQLLHHLIERLRKEMESQNMGVVLSLNIILRIQSDILEGEVLTNGWPDFTMAISQFSGDVTDQVNGLINCCVLSQSAQTFELVEQLEDVMKAKIGDYWIMADGALAKDLPAQLQLKAISKESPRIHSVNVVYDVSSYYLPEKSLCMLTKNGPSRCPEGYVLRKLKECHVEEIVAKWKYSTPEKRILLFTNLIKHCHSIGLFPKLESGEVGEALIGWCTQYSSGSLAHLFVHEGHRRKGLARVLVEQMCMQVAKDGEIPTVLVVNENTVSISLFRSLGFVELGSRSAVICSYV